MSDHNSPEAIKASVRTYMMVFGALAVLTAVTVGVSYLHLSFAGAVAVALLVASVKASLVALYFMHLKGEVKAIHWSLMLTAVFFVVLMVVPLATVKDRPGTDIAPMVESAGHGDSSGEHH